MGTLRLATRGSPLALRQTELVSELLRQAHPGLEVEPLVVRTQGDRDATSPLDADRGPRRVRHRGGGGGGRRPGRCRRALGQGHDLGHAGRIWCWAPSRCGPIPRRPRGRHAGRPAGRRPGGDRLGAASGPAGRAAPRPRLRRPAGQHGPTGRRRRGGKRLRRGHRRGRHGAPGLGGQGERRARPGRRAAAGRSGRHRGAVPGGRHRDRGSCSAPSTTSRVTGPCAPSAPSWRRSVAAARCPSAPSPSSPSRAARCSGSRDSWPVATGTP